MLFDSSCQYFIAWLSPYECAYDNKTTTKQNQKLWIVCGKFDKIFVIVKYKVSQTGLKYLLIVLATVYTVLFGISKENLKTKKQTKIPVV